MVKRNSWTTIYDFVNKANNHMLGSCMFQARSQPLLDEVKHITLRKKRNTAFLFLEFRFSEGQIISKGLFGVLEFSQKTNEQIRCIIKTEFVLSFFGRI